MRKITVTLAAIAMSISAIAQKDFQPGYIVTTSNDTIKGQLDYRNWEKNPSQVRFSIAGAEPKTYSFTDIDAFGVDGIDYYRKYTLPIDGNSVRETELPVYKTELIQTQTVFLRILAEGSKLNLYEYVDFKPHYFVSTAGGQVEELIYKVSRQGETNNAIVYAQYRTQLKQLLSLGSGGITVEQTARIDKIDYKEKDLAKYVLEQNGNSASSKINFDNVKPPRSRFFVGAGTTLMNLGFESNRETLDKLEFKNQPSFAIAVGVDFVTGRSQENLIARLELGFSNFKAEGHGENSTVTSDKNKNEYFLNQLNITPMGSIIYRFAKISNAKLYFGVGMGYNFSSYSKNFLRSTSGFDGTVTITEDYAQLENHWMAAYGKLGFITKNKWEVEASGQVFGSFVNLINTSQQGVPLTLRVQYHFR